MTQPAPLPSRLYRAAQVRAMDRYLIERCGIPGIELMNRAGKVALVALRERWPAIRTVSVVCGAGNNGGDGYVLARLARQAGLDVRVYPLVPEASLKGDALTACRAYREAGGAVLDFVPASFEGAEVLVDGLLGTGLDRPVTGLFREVILGMNRFRGKVLALDIPSGLCADTGHPLDVAVKADLTVSFIGLKQGLMTGEGIELCGELLFDDLGADPSGAGEPPSARLLAPWSVGLPRRPRAAHKGHYGHVLVVGGSPGFSGAARLAAEAAARVGAGLVSIATHPGHAAVLNAGRPELMCHGVKGASALDGLLARARVVAVGPGLGRSGWAWELWEGVLASGLPLVVDADALNLLAERPRRGGDWVLTPHPGEAARLLGRESRAIQADRYAAAAELQARYGGSVVLKGSGTLVLGEEGPPTVCAAGNPGMASGGMGDVLTGVIAGLMTQGLASYPAAELGVRLHGAAGDCAASEGGERGLLAADLLPHLRRMINR